MAIHPVPSRQARPCHKSRASPFKSKDQQMDIKVASHKLALQHSVRSQKLDERQLNKFFKSLEDLKIKRILQIDKEVSEQEDVLEKLNYDKQAAKEQRLARRGSSSKSANTESEFSFVLPDHFKRGPRPSLRRGSSNFDLYAFMMRRESDVTPRTKRSHRKTSLAKQSKGSPIHRNNSSLKSSSWEDGPVGSKEAWTEPVHRVVSPGKSEQFVASPSSHFSAAESVSLGSLPPSSPECDSGFPPKRFPAGSDWLDEVGTNDVNKGFRRLPRTRQPKVTRGRQQEVGNIHQTRNPRARETDKAVGQNRTRGETSGLIYDKLSQRIHEPDTDKKGVNLADGNFFANVGLSNRRRRGGPPARKLKKAVSFLFPADEEGDHEFVADESLGAGIMHKNSLLKDGSGPSAEPVEQQCQEPDCIFHNKAYRRGSRVDDEYTIDDYYRTVRGKPTVSPLFMPADSPRLWSRSRRQAVRPPSPSPSDFLREFDNVEAPKSTLTESDSFLSVRRPLKGSNRERMLKDKEENVRTTFKVMRQKMAGQRPLEFNQNYGTPTPNWKILNPLKLRHKINQSNPLHARWGL
ncbi:uncharacterized protein LOC117303442 [Asterias rubens]|uniref:uncharacterized protein LOC117303442 n=1 Tax=Asterias rubens TaxID=7604 RepID=UPI001454F67E|nr:uncharacterized protein LOC117303442 [Asterias rubens]